MAGLVAQQNVLPFGWQEDYDSRQYVDATIGDLPSNTTVAKGSAGIVEYVNGGPRFRMDDAVVAAPKGQWPAVAMEGGKKGDRIRVLMYGETDATFINTMDSRTNKAVVAAAGKVNTAAAGSANDNVLWGLVQGDGANGKTHKVFLFGSALYT